MDIIDLAVLSVRELITELSEVEANLRRWRSPSDRETPQPAVADLVHHEQVIVHELRRRRARSHHLGPRSGPARYPR